MGVKEFNRITDEMTAIYVRKNADYGNSFDKSLDEDGLLVSKIRLGDKYLRFCQLIKQESQVKDESIRDTLIDMANYAIMTVMWMDDKVITFSEGQIRKMEETKILMAQTDLKKEQGNRVYSDEEVTRG